MYSHKFRWQCIGLNQDIRCHLQKQIFGLRSFFQKYISAHIIKASPTSAISPLFSKSSVQNWSLHDLTNNRHVISVNYPFILQLQLRPDKLFPDKLL